MATTTVRIDEDTHRALRSLARETGENMQEMLSRAVEFYRRHRLLEQANAVFAALRSDAQAWRAECEERAAWHVTLADGLKGD